jgi:hypothetical protein
MRDLKQFEQAVNQRRRYAVEFGKDCYAKSETAGK